ncbi:DUF2783 domain-containing protein [Variovorax ureilyticus]|uniref:DUF2783 domain-containing protein n=1 Tax=Variovorax ureilyticus TaxID=1836198 RepID=A0ABU8VHB5_9BURK
MLNTRPTGLRYDDMYESLIAAHQGLTPAQSHLVNARLVLLLANHISDLPVLAEAFELARKGVVGEQPVTSVSHS